MATATAAASRRRERGALGGSMADPFLGESYPRIGGGTLRHAPHAPVADDRRCPRGGVAGALSRRATASGCLGGAGAARDAPRSPTHELSRPARLAGGLAVSGFGRELRRNCGCRSTVD